MGRELIIVKIDYPCQVIDDEDLEKTDIELVEIVIATTHYESEFNRKSKNINKWAQVEESYKILSEMFNRYKNVILCLDTNLTQEEEEIHELLFNKDWSDAWILKGTDNKKYTFDCKENIYLKLRKSRYQSRLDRILFKSTNCHLYEFNLVKDASD